MSKNCPKRWQKCLQRDFFFVFSGELFFWPGQRRYLQRRCLQSFKAVPFSYLEFFPKEGHSTMMDSHSSSRIFSLAALLKITCCCCGFMACPRDSMAMELLAAQKSWPPVAFAWVVSAWPRCAIGMPTSISAEIRVLTSKALVTSFLAISFYVILLSSLLSE